MTPPTPISSSDTRHPLKLFLLSFLHTYLVWVAAIKKAVHHGLVPALHSAAEQSVQRPSGHWQAYSLAPFHLVDSSFSFHHLSALSGGMEKSDSVVNLYHNPLV